MSLRYEWGPVLEVPQDACRVFRGAEYVRMYQDNTGILWCVVRYPTCHTVGKLKTTYEALVSGVGF
jgi:hypothetical protein